MAPKARVYYIESKGKKEVIDPCLTIKVVGHQWYWSYEYSDFISYISGSTSAVSTYEKQNLEEAYSKVNKLAVATYQEYKKQQKLLRLIAEIAPGRSGVCLTLLDEKCYKKFP